MFKDGDAHHVPVHFSCLLPSLERLGQMLGFRLDLPGLMDLIEQETGRSAPVNRKTAILGHRMSKRSWKKTLAFLCQSLESMGLEPEEFEQLLDPDRALPEDESLNALLWRSAVAGMRYAQGSPFARTCDYIDLMCDREREVFRYFHANGADAIACVDKYYDMLRELTFIPDACLNNLRILMQDASSQQPSEIAVLRLWMQWEPMLRLAAVVEVDLFFEAQSAATHGSVFSKIWPCWEEGELVEHPQQRYFDLLRSAIKASRHGSTTWKDLAGAVPVLKPRSDPDPENRRKELERWRKGKVQASDAKLAGFLRELGANDYEVDNCLLLYRVAWGIDRDVVNAIRAAEEPSKASAVLAEIFATYPRHRPAAHCPAPSI